MKINKTCTKHNTCKYLANINANQGVAIAPIIFYTPLQTWVIMLGLERGGRYKGEYNLFSGNGEKEDLDSSRSFCWLKCLIREFHEESTIYAPFAKGQFDFIFRSLNKKRIRYFLHHNTPVFLGLLPKGTSRKPINNELKRRSSDNKLPYQYKEMLKVDYFRLDNGDQIEGRAVNMSRFANAIRTKIDPVML